MTNRSQEIHKVVREVVANQLWERRAQIAEIIKDHISAVAEDANGLSLRIADDIITQLVGDAEQKQKPEGPNDTYAASRVQDRRPTSS